jgi:DNA polymerase
MDSFTALRWQWEMGATDFVGAEPRDWRRAVNAPLPPATIQHDVPLPFQATAPAAPAAPVLPVFADPDLSAVKTLDELRGAIAAFDGLEIKKSATNVVFGEGAEKPRVVFVGEAPGADEDRLGRPFVGVSGQLLDKMLASIGLSRAENSYITNVIHWRPPGNRQPTPQEIQMSLPFVRKHISLLAPEFMVVLGGSAAKAMLDINEGITRARGGWREYACDSGRKIPTLIMFHPAYLLRAPAQKALAWRDLLALQTRLA